MNNQTLLYEIAFTLVKGIGFAIGRQLLNTLNDASLLFTEKKSTLAKLPGMNKGILAEMHNSELLKLAEKEITFIEKNQIKPFFITHEDYPHRLKDCPDAPLIFFFKGNANLNTEKIISIVGTRNANTYGKEMVAKLMIALKEKYPDVLIVSGLAYGIDIAAHKSALKEDLSTIGVLAHGLDRIYPSMHRDTAVEMLNKGGLLTEFMSETNPDRQNFVKRNRIIAGLADCTIIVESAIKGGALITANIADSYNRDVLAYPGKATDKYSMGCNWLIKKNKAAMVTEPDDVFEALNWDQISAKKATKVVQQDLFLDLSDDEQKIINILTEKENAQVNALCVELNCPMSKLSSLLFNLEMNGLIVSLPGGIYSLRG